MPNSHPDVAKQIKRSLHLLVAATVVLAIFIGGLGVYSYVNTEETHSALCTLRQDLVVRVHTSKDFLDKHPKGIPGIPGATIRTTLHGQQRTIDALSSLSC